MISGKFTFLDLASLQAMQVDWMACLKAIAVANQSYSIAGRSFTRAQLSEVSDTLAEIAFAIAVKTGTTQRVVYPDFSGGS